MPSYKDQNTAEAQAPAPSYLTTPAKIKKAAVPILCKFDEGYQPRPGEVYEKHPENLVGCLNSAPYVIGETEHPALSLVFEGFAGGGAPVGEFEGVFRFLPYAGDLEGLRTVDFSALAGVHERLPEVVSAVAVEEAEFAENQESLALAEKFNAENEAGEALRAEENASDEDDAS
jgi:hypothetical protein